MADSYAALEEGLRAGLGEVSSSDWDILDRCDREQLYEMGRQAVRVAVAPFMWDERLGRQLDTGAVCRLLGITRQALAKKVGTHALVALPSGRSRGFPIWQFVIGDPGAVRPQVRTIVQAFRDQYPQATGTHIAAWAQTAQSELNDTTPAEWIERGQPIEPVLLAASRAAAGLAQ